MTADVTKMFYKAFGLSLQSEILFPELQPTCENWDEADVVIEIADLDGLWSELAPRDKKVVCNKELVMFQVPNVAVFCITQGKKITVSPMQEFDEDMVRIYILGSCMGALLLQRKVLPLHGSAVAIDGRAYGFIGGSGAGKSTLAAAFVSRGYQLLSDDVLAVSVSHDGIPLVIPSYPQQKLRQETLDVLGIESDRYRHIYQRENKFGVPVHMGFCGELLPLGGLFELVATEEDEATIRPIAKLERLYTLFCHTYRNFLIPRADLMEWHFKTSAGIASRIGFFRLSRPNSGFSAPHLVSLVLKTVSQEG